MQDHCALKILDILLSPTLGIFSCFPWLAQNVIRIGRWLNKAADLQLMDCFSCHLLTMVWKGIWSNLLLCNKVHEHIQAHDVLQLWSFEVIYFLTVQSMLGSLILTALCVRARWTGSEVWQFVYICWWSLFTLQTNWSRHCSWSGCN